MNRKKKIICTIGTTINDPSVLNRLRDRGVDYFRINLSHTLESEIEEKVVELKKYGVPIILDTESLQIRSGNTKEFYLKEGQKIKIYDREIDCDGEKFFLKPFDISKRLNVGDLCDGTVARFYKKKNAMGKWLDESAGFIGISIVFFSLMMKTFLENNSTGIIVLGFIAIFGYLMMNIAAILSEVIRERFKLKNPMEKLRKKTSKSFGIPTGLLGFSFDIQWTLVALGVALNQPYALFIIFGALANLQWIARYFIFFGK